MNFNSQSLVPLCVGIVVGLTFTYMQQLSTTDIKPTIYSPDIIDSTIKDSEDIISETITEYIDAGHKVYSPVTYVMDDSVAQELKRNIRVLCLITTYPQTHKFGAEQVKATWGPRCTILLFMSSVNDTYLPSIGLNVTEDRLHLWGKTKEAFKYVYKHYLDKAEWFLKADDDTYVILENLRYLLSGYKSSDPLYMGCRFRRFVRQGFMNGGAGYVLSKEAVRRFVEEALPDKEGCRQLNTGAEDMHMGKCLETVNVVAIDTRDGQRRGRFFPFPPELHLVPFLLPKDFFYWDWVYYPEQHGLDCCSDTAISFHYVPPNLMHVLDYTIYRLRPFGIRRSFIIQNTTADDI